MRTSVKDASEINSLVSETYVQDSISVAELGCAM
jgi:hypothetical protein